MRTLVQISIAAALLVAFVPTADAKKCGGVRMPDTITVDGTSLKLNGMGMREATVFSVNVYAAGMYLENKSSDGANVAGSDQKKRLVMEFVRDVDKNKIVDAYKESFNHTAEGNDLDSKIQTLLGWMDTVSTGDEQVYTYIPGEGLTYEFNGTEKGTIEGADFAEAFFLIWFGSKPPNADLKSGLLGGSCG